jgi:hypothetical protein
VKKIIRDSVEKSAMKLEVKYVRKFVRDGCLGKNHAVGDGGEKKLRHQQQGSNKKL